MDYSPKENSGYKPISEWDRQIASRAAAIRRFRGLSQVALADIMVISRAQLANIELGRVPLPLEAGFNLCKTLDIRPEWLLFGDEPQKPFPPPHPSALAFCETLVESLGRTPFSESFPVVYGIYVRGMKGPADPNGPLQWGEFWAAAKAAKAMQPAKTLEESGKEALTCEPPAVTTAPVQPIMPTLIERLRQATGERGRKTELAAWLGVPRQRVNDWLSGQREPDGETTLRLLNWVTADEAKSKTKSPASANTPAGLQTQVTKRNENESNSGPP